MFDEIGRVPDEPATRRYALLSYGVWCFLGLAMFGVALWKRGVSQPIDLAFYAAAFLLSLTWFMATIRSGPSTKRKIWMRTGIAYFLFMAPGLARFIWMGAS